jgi:leucyl aminopeptidase
MTQPLSPTPAMGFVPDSSAAADLHLVDAETLESWADMQPRRVRAWITALGFTAKPGEVVLVPDADGALALAAVGRGTARQRARQRFVLGGAGQIARAKLPLAPQA